MSAETPKENNQEGGRSAFGNVMHAVAGVALGGHPVEWFRRTQAEGQIRQERLRAMGVRDVGEMQWAVVDDGDWPLPSEIGDVVPPQAPEEVAGLIRAIPDEFITGS
jgi:hypothetical protein